MSDLVSAFGNGGCIGNSVRGFGFEEVFGMENVRDPGFEDRGIVVFVSDYGFAGKAGTDVRDRSFGNEDGEVMKGSVDSVTRVIIVRDRGFGQGRDYENVRDCGVG